MNEPSSREITDPSLPPREADPWPLFPLKKVASDPPPPTVGFFRRGMAFFMDLILVEWITAAFTIITLSARELALGAGIGGILWEGMDQWALFHSRSRTLVFLAYFTFFASYGGQTPGKMLYRFRVVLNDGSEIPVFKALIRTLGYLLSFLSLGLGFLAAAVLPSGRALHDYLSGTRVEKKPPA